MEYDEDTYYEEKSMEELENMVEYKGTDFDGLKKYGPSMLAGEHRTVIVVESVHSGMKRIHRLDMPLATFKDRLKLKPNSGIFIQDLFPELTSEQREALMTGISDKEWDDIFPEGDQYDMETKEGLTFGERKKV